MEMARPSACSRSDDGESDSIVSSTVPGVRRGTAAAARLRLRRGVAPPGQSPPSEEVDRRDSHGPCRAADGLLAGSAAASR